MRENLEELGFQVEVAENLTGLGIKKKVGSFVQRHKRAASTDGARGAEVRTLIDGQPVILPGSSFLSVLDCAPLGTAPECPVRTRPMQACHEQLCFHT